MIQNRPVYPAFAPAAPARPRQPAENRLAAFLAVAVFALMPFPQSLAGENSPLNISASDCFGALLFFAVLPSIVRRGRVFLGPVGLPMAVFLIVALLSGIGFWHGTTTVLSWVRILKVTLLPVVIFASADISLATMRRCFGYFLVGINVLALFSVWAFLHGGIGASEYAMGIHKNALGPLYACGIVVALGLLFTEKPRGRTRLWILVSLFAATAGIILCLSRGGWVAAAAGILMMLVLTRNMKAFFGSLFVLVPVIIVIWQALPQAAAEYASNVSASAYTIKVRIDAMDTVLRAFNSNPLFGVGIDLAYDIDPHDVMVLMLGQAGIIGLTAFLGMFAGGFYTFFAAAKYAGKDALARQVLLLGSGVLLVSIVHGTMDIYWRRGAAVLGWSCVGLAVNVIRIKYAERRRLAAERAREMARPAPRQMPGAAL